MPRYLAHSFNHPAATSRELKDMMERLDKDMTLVEFGGHLNMDANGNHYTFDATGNLRIYSRTFLERVKSDTCFAVVPGFKFLSVGAFIDLCR